MRKGFFRFMTRSAAWLMAFALILGSFCGIGDAVKTHAAGFTEDKDSEKQEIEKRNLEEPILYRFDTGEETYKGNVSYRPWFYQLAHKDFSYYRNDPQYDPASKVIVRTSLPKDMSRGGLIATAESNTIDLDTVGNYGQSSYVTYTSATSATPYYTEDIYYDLNFEGTGILVEVSDTPQNDKLIYAVAAPSKGESEYEWKLVENKIDVVVSYDYEYTRVLNYTDWQLISQCTTYSSTNPEHQVWGQYYVTGFGDDTQTTSNKQLKILNNSNLEKESDLSGVLVTAFDDTKVGSDGFYINTYGASAPECKYPVADSDYYKDYGDTFKMDASGIVLAKKEKLHFTKTKEFWFIDTSKLFIDQKDMDVHVKWIIDDKTIEQIEKYRFSQQTKGKLDVRYKYTDGFSVSGMIPKSAYTTEYRNNLDNVFTNEGTEYELKWKTSMMQSWHVTTPNTINDDIPIDLYNITGTTLFFMDVCNPTKIVSVRIPGRAKTPNMKLKLDSMEEPVLNGLKAGKHQFRAWYYDNSNVVYISNISEELGTKADPSYTQADMWYDYVGGKAMSLAELVKTVPKPTSPASIDYPEIFVEARTSATDKKAASEIMLFHINEQYSLESSVSSNTTISFEEGRLLISDAGNNNVYQYRFSPDEKWKKAKKRIVLEKNITSGVTVYIRKKAKTSKAKTITLPSTTTSFNVTISENNPTMTYKLVNGKFVLQ